MTVSSLQKTSNTVVEMKKLSLLLLSVCFGISTQVRAAGHDSMSQTTLDRYGAEISAMTARDQAKAADAEIGVARKWIDDGRRRIRLGRKKKAALVEERLAVQMKLIRVLVAAETARVEAERIAAQADAVEQELVALRAQLMRLVKKNRRIAHQHATPVRREGLP